ncbi:hypothetical protein [Salipaludibacillus sp. CF4.18]|uniref:hypothetical protein n=1 Tax=Salipaludibacillus sp. CF4.18 TaxID=3373081 RepID=UPI003EE63602
MSIQIASINTKFGEGDITGVDVRFSFKTESRKIDSSIRVELSPEEYQGNESIDKLKAKLKEVLIEELTSGEEIPTAE